MGIKFDFDPKDGNIGVQLDFGKTRIEFGAGYLPKVGIAGVTGRARSPNARLQFDAGFLAPQLQIGANAEATFRGFGGRVGVGPEIKGALGMYSGGLFLPDEQRGEAYLPLDPLEIVQQEVLDPQLIPLLQRRLGMDAPTGPEAAGSPDMFSTAEIPYQSRYGPRSWMPTADGGRRYPDGTIFYPDGRRVQEGNRPNRNEIPIEPEGTPDRPGLPQESDRPNRPTTPQQQQPQQVEPGNFPPSNPNDPFRPRENPPPRGPNDPYIPPPPNPPLNPNAIQIRMRRVR